MPMDGVDELEQLLLFSALQKATACKALFCAVASDLLSAPCTSNDGQEHRQHGAGKLRCITLHLL